jgi:nucleoside-diphosphate-sugar epimerase
MIVVTGGCGFIGSEVVRQLRAKGHAVRVVDNMSKPSSKVPDGVELVRGDLAQAGVAREAFQGASACVNLAARIGGIGYFHKLPAEILSENNLIYSHTFEAAVAASMERMVFVSSSMVFESATTFPSREEDLRSHSTAVHRVRLQQAHRSSGTAAPSSISTGCRTRSCGRSTRSVRRRRRATRWATRTSSPTW